MRFVVVTGMSGGGKSTAMKFLEDAGFFCVDNLPVPLIEKFMELLTMPNNEISKAALGLDVRAEQTFGEALKILDRMRQNGFIFEILFMDAGDNTLVKRYKETRRMHPLCTPPQGRVLPAAWAVASLAAWMGLPSGMRSPNSRIRGCRRVFGVDALSPLV